MRSLHIIATIVLLTSCGSSRKQIERAATYEREGMLAEAYDRYAELYLRKPREVEAHVGMKRTAQGLFNRMQDKASAAYAMGDLATGDGARQEAINYKASMDRQGLELEWAPLFEAKRAEAMRDRAQRLYADAESAFREERFKEAEDLAYQCSRLDPERRDAEHLYKLAQVEPAYREALLGQELGLWREAYRQFDRVAKLDAGHKDTMTRLAECREKASYTVAYVPLYNANLYPEMLGLQSVVGQLETQFAANVKQEVLDLQDPLIVMVDRDNTEELLAEQQRQMSGVYDDRSVAAAGKLLGARYVLTGKILRFDDVLRKEIEVQMQLLDAESGRILQAEIVRVNKQEIGRGAPRGQLLERAAKRMALQLAEFDPSKG
ncbi:MAG: hypothetical protein KA941_00275 [Flavobacteriales bacterium]|nr:hypothetical protein [Flavobacteriales bacterium]